MVSGPEGNLCLSLYLCFYGLIDLHLFLILMRSAPVLLTGVVCSLWLVAQQQNQWQWGRKGVGHSGKGFGN